MVAVVVGLGACASSPPPAWRQRAATVDVVGLRYHDNSGLTVTTGELTAVAPVHENVDVEAHTVVDTILVERKPIDPGDPGAGSNPSGHPPHDPDAVTSASSTASGGAVAEKTRTEMIGAVRVFGALAGRPATVALHARASSEKDYAARSAALSGTLELARRNVVVGGFVGAGEDHVVPVEAPPGQGDDWPARHDRWTAGLSVSQLLAPTLVVGAGVATTAQSGQLANPYRRALVRTTLFPEVVPDERTRRTAFLSASWSIAPRVALHARQGVYEDSWGVVAVIPEAALALELHRTVVVTTRYRYYRQWAADFYQARYQDLEPLLSGDPRLGPIRDHTASVELGGRFFERPDRLGALVVGLSWDVSWTDYELLATDLIVGHTLGVSAGAEF